MKYYYLISFQYLGFRFHGWQKQPGVITVQSQVDAAIKKVLKLQDFHTLGASRTDSMVSATSSLFELMTTIEINKDLFIENVNSYLSPDIRLLSIKEVDKSFKIISGQKLKEYHYYFSFGGHSHPFCAPFMTHIQEDLNLQAMQEAANHFTGIHSFHNYCHKDRVSNWVKEILKSDLVDNDILVANFFPEKTYIYKVIAPSFMRYQVRMMMGALFRVGMNQLSLIDFYDSLKINVVKREPFLAPASGLCLFKIET